MKIAIPLFPSFTALDAVGPYEVLSRVPGATVTFVGARRGPLRNDTGSLALEVDATFEELDAPDVLVVPGGPRVAAMLDDAPLIAWIARAHAHSQWTTSVCTGSLLLAAAGVLRGVRATTHWRRLEKLGELGAVPVSERVVFSGKIVTAAGVSAGIDMALALAARLAGDIVAQAIQLGIEYDPQPPFNAGSIATAPPDVVALVRGRA